MNQTNQNQQETEQHDLRLHSDQPPVTEYDAVINDSINHIFQSILGGTEASIANLAAEYSSQIAIYHSQSTMYQERTLELKQQMLQLMNSIKPPNFEDVTTPVKPNQQSQTYNEGHGAQEE